MINLLTTIKIAAEAKGYQFCYGDGRYFEQTIQNTKLTDGQLGLMFNIVSFNPIIENRQFNGELEYEVQMFLFRKFELGKVSSVKETLEQKFEARMDEIQQKLLYFVTELTQCNDDIDLLSPRYTLGVNVTAVNVDGWFIDCRLKLFNQYPTA
jgi:hypothetical protein